MPDRKTFQGIMVEAVTPVSDDMQIDGHRIDLEVDRLVDAGVAGLVPSASTGEFTTLSVGERKFLMSRYIRAAKGRIPIVPGTGALTTGEAVDLSRYAEGEGASGVLVVPPYYGGVSSDGLKRYLDTIGKTISIPIVYYHIPGSTGVRLTNEELDSLGNIENVTYVKDTTGDPSLAPFFLMKTDDKLIEYVNGWDTLTFHTLSLGGRVCIWGAAAIFPDTAVALLDSIDRSLADAREIWSRLWPICAFLGRVKYAAGVKAALDILGLSAGTPRAPLLAVAGGEREVLRDLLAAANLRGDS